MKVEHETENATMNAAAPEQVAVGLSDEQVIAWCDYIDWEENSYYAEKFTGWLKTQTFKQSVNSDLLDALIAVEACDGNIDIALAIKINLAIAKVTGE